MNLSDFQPGDILVITHRNKQGDDKRAVEVTLVDYNGLGGITYAPAYGTDYMEGGQGWFDPTKIGTTKYGKVAVEKIGRARKIMRWQPKPGDRGYDLCC